MKLYIIALLAAISYAQTDSQRRWLSEIETTGQEADTTMVPGPCYQKAEGDACEDGKSNTEEETCNAGGDCVPGKTFWTFNVSMVMNDDCSAMKYNTSEPHWNNETQFHHIETLKRPIGECTTNVIGSSVVFECMGDWINEHVYIDASQPGAVLPDEPTCNGSAMYIMPIMNGCNKYTWGGMSAVWDDTYCMEGGPRVEVVFTLTLEMTSADYDANKGDIKKQLLTLLHVDESEAFFVDVAVVEDSSARRQMHESLTKHVGLEVTVKTQNATKTAAVVEKETFAGDLETLIRLSTGLDVPVVDVVVTANPATTTTTTAAPAEEDDGFKVTAGWVFGLLFAIGILAGAIALILYLTQNGDKIPQKDVEVQTIN